MLVWVAFSLIYTAVGLWAAHSPTVTLGFVLITILFKFVLCMTFLSIYSIPHVSILEREPLRTGISK